MAEGTPQDRPQWDSGPPDPRPQHLPPAEQPVHREILTFDIAAKQAPKLLDFAIVFHKLDPETKQPYDPDQPEPHEFRAILDQQASAMLTLGSMVRWTADGLQRYDMTAMLGFFNAVLVEGDYERLVGLIQRKDLGMTMEDVGEVFKGLVERIVGRPTEPSSGSFSAQPRTGASSTAVASWRE